MRLFVLSVFALIFPVTGESPSSAQELNVRKDAPPSSKAAVGRLMPKSRVQAAQQGKDLSQDIINTDCNPIEIGGIDTKQGGKSPKENVNIIRGNIVNLCR